MSNYILSPDGKLYHAGDDYLQHWKYIKREKVNGKWRYFYDNEAYRNYKSASAYEEVEKIRARKAAQERNNLTSKVNDAYKRFLEAEKMSGSGLYLAESGPNYTTYLETDKGKKMNDAEEDYYTNKAKIPALTSAAIDAQRKANDAHKNTVAAKEQYEDTTGAKLANFLNESSDKIDKAKNWVDGLFSKKKKK